MRVSAYNIKGSSILMSCDVKRLPSLSTLYDCHVSAFLVYGRQYAGAMCCVMCLGDRNVVFEVAHSFFFFYFLFYFLENTLAHNKFF